MPSCTQFVIITKYLQIDLLSIIDKSLFFFCFLDAIIVIDCFVFYSKNKVV